MMYVTKVGDKSRAGAGACYTRKSEEDDGIRKRISLMRRAVQANVGIKARSEF